MLSPAEIQERLKQAAEAVDQAGVPEDLRAIAFERSLEALGVGALPSAGVAAQQPATGPQEPGGGSTAASAGGLLSKMSGRLGLDHDAVSRVFEEDDGQLHLILRRTMLPEPNRKAASMRHIALLVVAGRQAAGLEEWTAFDSIREECRELKVYDQPNFATEVGKLEFRTQGGRNSKEAKANRHHYDDAADLIRRITQAGES